MDSPRFSRELLAFLIGVPLAWAVLLMFHPTGEGEAITYADLSDKLTPWLVVHLGMLVFIPLMGVAVYLLLNAVVVAGSGARSGGSTTARRAIDHRSTTTAPRDSFGRICLQAKSNRRPSG